MSRLVTRPTKWHVCPAKTQISLGIWSESSLCAQWVAKDPSFLHADSEDSDQTGRMPRLIWVFAGRTYHFVGFVTRWLKCSAHEIMALFVLRKIILRTRIRSHLVGLDVWFFVGPFVYFHNVCVRTVKVLARMCGCAGSPELSLVAYWNES